jgi:hypothetical protein
MRSYLSQIAGRATGDYKLALIRPVARDLPADSALSDQNPFEEVIETRNLNQNRVDEVAPSSSESDAPVTAESSDVYPDSADRPSRSDGLPSSVKQADPDGPILPTRGFTDENPREISVSSSQEEKPSRDSDGASERVIIKPALPEVDSTEASPHIDEVSELLARDYKAEDDRRPDSRDMEQVELSISPSADVIPDSETKGTYRQFTGTPLVPERQEGLNLDEPPTSRLFEGLSGDSAAVPKLQPKMPGNPVSPPVFQRGDREPKLVIGRLKVEVVAPPPTPPEREIVRVISHTPEPQRENSSSRCKLRFGLGQI